MDIVVPVINGVGEIFQTIPAGTYQIDILKVPGYENEIYDENTFFTTTITIEPSKRESIFYVDATGKASVLLKERLSDGTEQVMTDETVAGIVVHRSDEGGNYYNNSIVMAKNSDVFPQLPYSYNQVKQIADGPNVSLALDLSSIPSGYELVSTSVVTQQLQTQSSTDNVYTFVLAKTETATVLFHIYEGSAPAFKKIDSNKEEDRIGYLGIDGTLYLTE